MSFSHRTLLMGLTALTVLGGLARPALADTLTTIDFPSTAASRAAAVNDSGNVVGVSADSTNQYFKGYERYANGTFSAALMDPDDNQNYTRALGINNAGTIVGDYYNVTGNLSIIRGYILRNGVYTTFNVDGDVYSTTIWAINNAGDFAGEFSNDNAQEQAFLDVGGTVTTFAGPAGNTGTIAQGINSSDVVVGQYIDSSGVSHAFSRNPSTGALTTIDVPNSQGTIAYGINDGGTIVGIYADANNVNHGFINKAGVITTFDVPSATSTTIRGINNAGVFVGVYRDSSGNQHGFIDAPPSTPTHLLWDNTNGTASLWTVAADYSFTQHSFGPYSGWTAKSVADGPDGTQHLLWTNTNGTASLWNVATDGTFTQHTFGPYSGWTAVSVSTSPGGSSHLLWDNTNGTASLWTVNTSTGAFTSTNYGPYSGWTANEVADGTTVTDLLWTNVNGTAAGYRINSSGTVSKTFGPYANYGAKSVSVGPDDGAHLLWDKTDGTVSLWNVDFNSGSFSSAQYGPYSGWSGKAIATGADDVTHILWDHAPDGMASLWNVSSAGTSSHGYGPYSGWSAVAVSAAP